ncbi:MAG: RND transporter [Desulfofustis sp.]|nr:RND transporter [Desulfofustis sp.]RZW20160.1 MAG: RND transporter [Desulfobulbaceae bacterium]MBT8347205.1 RND transporter [Desulfofustis sp.]MBT8353493.1 RND transporter [Desulfofustis sp.]NNF47457.1 RND transporter [Desulfofustis sp.]
MWSLIQSIPVWLLVVLCLTLGLAPFVPEPHIWEKLKMLAAGSLSKPIDIFDLLLHALPFVLLALRLIEPYLQK